ncbi:MAG TPA: bifunctional diaminohydroxyphosphoribosylaminopyrimidine deaminase/5-amino-6-(5-phosphoribosylamino)uracil reductase RibD [Armatimonadota bacterium]|nr:bifunctional diaminohydroxyphosphoribosylaminopyrimidine deaminase/5-amino-6-(5-phosphoribosylamino)uracil reductase RibD [Armatimonadota bacterium]
MANSVYMKRALTLARRGRTSPNPMVGAVVVRDGQIVGEGCHPRAGEPHAEVFALERAGPLANGADLYVTLEPCCHHGRTPPCTDAIIRSGVRRVFAAMIDPGPTVSGKGIEILRSAGIEVQVGLLEPQARRLNEAYIKRVTTGLPFVLWKAAMTLDGKIATRTGDSRWITGERARKEVHRLRSRYDAVLVGIGTVLADDPELTVRGIRGAVNPLRVVVDSRASLPLDARVLDSEAQTLVAVTGNAPEEKVEALRNAGARVLVLPAWAGGQVDLRALMSELSNQGLNGVLLEGGGELAASMLEMGLVDKGLIFIAPKIVGGRSARTPVEGEGIELMSRALGVSKPRIRRFGEDIGLEFDVKS